MSGRRAREKGKRGEREAAKILSELGLPSRRGQQYSGTEGKDVVGPPGFHFEVKRTERFRPRESLAQAEQDAQEGEIPVVLHKENRGDWIAVIFLEDLPDLAVKVFLQLASGNVDEEHAEQ